MKHKILFLVALLAFINVSIACDVCYKAQKNNNCPADQSGIDYYTMHMSVHPHLDAFWIFNFESYYDPKPSQGGVRSYFAQNRFNSVKQIFNTATDVLWQSKKFRQTVGQTSQKAHRSFFNSEMGFFKRWYFEQPKQKQQKVKELLKSRYWQIVGGGFVEHDQGCAYYDDIIENFQIGLRFLKENFDYFPKAAISADSFGHSQSTLAILAHLGIQGYFVQRSDQHILLKNKTEFIWKAKSSNGDFYGALPTHIRWAIHGFQDQFVGGNQNEQVCSTKQMYIQNMRKQNQFLKRILKSNHIMRYFGHDFQQFNEYSYKVIEGIMEQFSKQKCPRVIAIYGNPTEYFMTLMGEVWKDKVKPVATRSEDIMPIWDYDSGLYWTGYYTTDPYHKKDYRDAGRMLHLLRKAFLPQYISNPTSNSNIKLYDNLERLAEQVSYAQHHDGISGTSKYTVMDDLERTLDVHLQNVTQPIMDEVFETEFPINTNNPIFRCEMDQDCTIPQKQHGDVYLKIFNSAGDRQGQPVKINLPYDQYYKPETGDFQINCYCHTLPCNCTLYLFTRLFTYTPIRLKKTSMEQLKQHLTLLTPFQKSEQFSFNESYFNIKLKDREYSIGYKKVAGQSTDRSYAHLSRYGDLVFRRFTIRSGKYALGNNPNKINDLSSIAKVFELESPKMRVFIIKWRKEAMKTVITILKDRPNEWKVETHSSAQAPTIQDLYLEVGTQIENQAKFHTDSNGWLTLERTLFKHQDYQAYFSPQKFDDINGNSYPMTAFAYIQDKNDKVSLNTDRPQGFISYLSGRLWANFDRTSTDDGKWVYETTYRTQYQKFTHWVTVQNNNYNERKIQTLYDQPIYIQGNLIQPNQRVQGSNYDFSLRDKWASIAGIDGLKMLIKPWNDSTVTVRVHNLDDKNSKTVGLFANKTSPLLTTFYGNQIRFSHLEESALGGNMNYQKFLQDKWNWQQVVDLSKENSIFDKTFGENITLRPLEIRTFTFTNLSIVQNCEEPSKLLYESNSTSLKLNTSKQMPKRTRFTNQKIIAHYLLQENHCDAQSPVLMENMDETSRVQMPKQQIPKPTKPTPNPRKPQQPKPQQLTPIDPENSNKPTIDHVARTYEQIRQKINKQVRIQRHQKLIYFQARLKQIEKDIKQNILGQK